MSDDDYGSESFSVSHSASPSDSPSPSGTPSPSWSPDDDDPTPHGATHPAFCVVCLRVAEHTVQTATGALSFCARHTPLGLLPSPEVEPEPELDRLILLDDKPPDDKP